MTLEEKIIQLETELEKVKAELAESKQSVWLPEKNQEYCFITGTGYLERRTYGGILYDSSLYKNNNVFKYDDNTIKHMDWYNKNVFRVQNKLMQLHELLCPDYFPDWDNSKKENWYLGIYEGSWHKYWTTRCDFFTVYFTEEAAKRACEILNSEKFMMGDDV